MRNIRLVLEYDGTDLAGWQRQSNGPTVQAHLEDALAEMTGTAVKVTGASRTDAGVHALGQVANFQTAADIPLVGFMRGLNSKLPASIAVRAIDQVPEAFSSRFWSIGKHYRYAILARAARSPLRGRTAWHRPRALDQAAMRAAAAHLVGEHDFASFRAAGCTAATTTRRISAVDVTDVGDDLIEIHVRGNAFLRNMVRIVAGTLVGVGEGRFSPGEVADMLAARDRTQAGQTAPARGLTLVQVFYDEGPEGPRPRNSSQV